ncbi:hypothetical protein HGRIS_011196 [Hohenbuehelia grisea]|uniref:Uncharacterized protein n=1 Tax=Hohenbuehelia grisea TaxID=104357 RepID=A0ABR3JWK3_9AGAR
MFPPSLRIPRADDPFLQALVIVMIIRIDQGQVGVPSRVMADLSEYAAFPFLAAFDIPSAQSGPKQITSMAAAKKMMPLSAELFLRFKECAEIYADGDAETILSVYSIPMRIKFHCLAPSNFGKVFGQAITDECERAEDIWRQRPSSIK